MAAGLKLACALVLTMLVAALIADALTCSDISSQLSPCLSYLRNGGSVPSKCCSGVKYVNNKSNTASLPQQACKCIKSLVSEVLGIKSNYVSSLPGKCGVNLHYKISMNTNCNRYILCLLYNFFRE